MCELLSTFFRAGPLTASALRRQRRIGRVRASALFDRVTALARDSQRGVQICPSASFALVKTCVRRLARFCALRRKFCTGEQKITKNEILAARARCWSEVENSGSNGPESEFDTLCATGWTGLKKLWDMPLDVVLVLEGTSWPERAGKFSKVLSTLLEVFEKLVHQGFQSRAKSGKQSEVISGTTVISPSRGLSEKLSYRRTNCSSDQKGRRPHKHRPVDIDGRTGCKKLVFCFSVLACRLYTRDAASNDPVARPQ